MNEKKETEKLSVDEMKNIINQLAHPQPYEDLQTANYFINLCNKLSRMIDSETAEKKEENKAK